MQKHGMIRKISNICDHEHIVKAPRGPFYDLSKYRQMPDKCSNKNCGKTLKNKKHYRIGNKIDFPNGYWTYEKVCTRCGTVNSRT
jgi:hypothetical protein